MNLKDNEKRYYDKVIELYHKYGKDIPDFELMQLNIINKGLGISFQRSQEIFKSVQNEVETMNTEINIPPVTENKPDEKFMPNAAEIANNNLAPVEDPGEINKWKVIFWYTIGFFTIIFWGIGLIIMIWETIVVFRHKNKQYRYAKYIIERYNTKQ